MTASARIEPDVDSFEKSTAIDMGTSPISPMSNDSRSSSVLSQQSTIPSVAEKSTVTPMPVWLDASLAVMTLGLSVPAFHAVRGVSKRRAAKKAGKIQQADTPSGYLVPSSVVRTGTTAARPDKAMELDSLPVDPPPYSPGGLRQTPSQDVKAKAIAELP